MDTQEQYRKALQKILESSEFKDSNTYSRLLSYLFEAYLRQEVPKETTIAIDLFHRDASFNPSDDTIVRVYIHELRKRLKVFYQTEGKKEKTRLVIPKGGYELKFTSAQTNKLKINPYLGYGLIPVLLISLVLNLMLFQDLANNNQDQYSSIKNSSIWYEILGNDKPILIVIGDVFFFQEKRPETESVRVIRDENINSPDDLEKYAAKNPSIDVTPLQKHTYLIEYSAFSLKDLIPVISSANKSFSIKLCSDVNVQDLKSYNIIYIGFVKSLGIFKLYFERSKFKITSDYSVALHSDDSDTVVNYYAEMAKDYHKDYGLIVKLAGPDNNPVLLLSGLRFPGTMAMVDKVTDSEEITEMENSLTSRYGKMPANFEILYEVSGLQRQYIKSNFVYMNKTDDVLHNIWLP